MKNKLGHGDFHVSIATYILLILSIVVGQILTIPTASAQEPPDEEFLFFEDRKQGEIRDAEKKALRERKRAIESQKQIDGQFPFDVNARNVQFDSTGKKILADGDVIISYSSSIVEADSGVVDLQTNIADLEGNVRISDVNAELAADRAKINLDTGTGSLENADLFFEEGDYRLRGRVIEKTSEEEFELSDCFFTTCRCPTEGADVPWGLSAREAYVQQEGYAAVKHVFLEVQGVPVFYTPYLTFPVKTKRQTGFLAPSFGIGRKSGFELSTPFYWALSHSADATITPLIETEVRYGLNTEFRKVFSYSHSLDFGVTYLSEAWRDGKLLGTNVDGLDDPTIEEDRVAAFIDYSNSIELPDRQLQLLVDGNYVADDLMLRELDLARIGNSEDRFVQSRALARTTLFETHSVDVLADYNQALISDDDFVLQRLPEAQLSGFTTYRPFGYNPYGLKFVVSDQLILTNFQRSESFDGFRGDLKERVEMPFHFRNFFDGEIGADVRGTVYELSETQRVIEGLGLDDDVLDEELESSADRVVPGFDAKIGTVFEKVFTAPDGNLIKSIGELGRWGRQESLERIKHTVEPSVSYRYVPDVDQTENPLFDGSDRLESRNVVTYALTQRLYARYEPRNQYLYGIEETTPNVGDIPALSSGSILDDDLAFGVSGDDGLQYSTLRQGSVRELAALKLAQSYDLDFEEDITVDENGDEIVVASERDALSDLSTAIVVTPNEYVAVAAKADYNAEENEFSAYSIDTQLKDKRGDELRNRFRFIDDRVRQLETGLEIRVHDSLRVGYYSRYDDLEGEFIENKLGFRYISQCNCWMFDLEFADRVNPNESDVTFTVTLLGLGEIGNTFFTRDEEDDGA